MGETTVTKLGAPPTGSFCDVCGRTPEDLQKEDISFTDQNWYRVKYRYKNSPRYELECETCHFASDKRAEKRNKGSFEPELR